MVQYVASHKIYGKKKCVCCNKKVTMQTILVVGSISHFLLDFPTKKECTPTKHFN